MTTIKVKLTEAQSREVNATNSSWIQREGIKEDKEGMTLTIEQAENLIHHLCSDYGMWGINVHPSTANTMLNLSESIRDLIEAKKE